jgi:hypothetical protein
VQGIYDAIQFILQILRDPAWSGIAGICALIGIPLAILLARQSKTSKPQEQQNMHIPPGEIRHFIGGSYRRATLAKEFVNDEELLYQLIPPIQVEGSRC